MRGSRKSVFALTALFSIPVVTLSVTAFAHDNAEAPAQQTQPSDFAIVVTVSETGITAACEQGCAWTRLSAAYPAGTYRITAEGIQPVGESVTK